MDSEESEHSSLKTQSAWLLFAKLLGFAFAFILPLIVVRVLSKEEFGLYRMSFLLVMNAVAILPFSISLSAYYYLARDKTKRPAAVLNIMLVHLLVGVLACLFTIFFPGLIGIAFGSERLGELAPLIGLAILLWLFSVFLEHVAVANREPKVSTVFIVFAQLSKTVLLAGFALWFGTVESILWAAIVQALIQTLILIVYLHKRFPRYWAAFDWEFFKEHIAYAAPFGFAGTLWFIQTDLHYYFVNYRFGEAMLAVYAIGCFQLPLVNMISESVISVLIPRMSELEIEDDKQEMIRLSARAMEKLAFVFFPFYTFLIVVAELFIVTLFTDKYLESIPIFIIFLTLLPFSILISDPVIRAYEDLGKFLLKVRIVSTLILVGLLILAVNYSDLRGVLAVVVVVRIVEMIFIEIVAFRSIGTKLSDLWRLKNILKSGILSIFSGIVTFFLLVQLSTTLKAFWTNIFAALFQAGNLESDSGFFRFLTGSAELGVYFVTFCVVYLGGSALIGTITDEEKENVRRLLGKLFRRD